MEIQLLPDGSPASVALFVDATPIYFLATAHRPLIRRVGVVNLTLPDPDETDEQLVLTCRLESAAGPGFVTPVAREFPLPAKGVPIELSSFSPIPNRGTLALLDERIQGALVLEARWADTLVGQTRIDVEFLAHNQWMFLPAYYDTLAAFVMPNTSALDSVLVRARKILLEETGSSSTQGYQSGPERADEIAAAIYRSLQEEQLTYSNPPAAFEGYGQKVRTPEDVMTERTATCLDSAVLYASCLLRVGIDAHVVLVTGHAFATYCRYNPLDRTGPFEPFGEAFRSETVESANVLAILHETNLLRSVETTLFTSRDDASFTEATRASADYFSTKQGELDALVNVQQAILLGGVVPHPGRLARTHESADTTWLASTEPPIGSPARDDPDGSKTESPLPSDQELAPSRVESWKRSLLNLTFANPLLRMKKSAMFRLELPGGIGAAVENRLMGDAEVEILPATAAPSALRSGVDIATSYERSIGRDGRVFWPDVREVDREIEQFMQHPDLSGLPVALARIEAEAFLDKRRRAEIAKHLRSLKRKADDIERQSGTNNLFLCVGLLEWMGIDHNRGSAPLFLVPVRFTGSAKDGYRLAIDSTSDPMPNQCLVEKLRADHGVDIPMLANPPLDDAGIDVAALIGGVRAALIERPFGGAVVHDDLTLSVLDFASFRLWKDLRDHWKDLMDSPVFAHLVERPGETFQDPNADSELPEVLMPELHDASQTLAVQWAAAGRSFVLQGPPGTGKSQTITNLLAASMARGLKVLFVAEKATALDVVRRRLAGVGLDPLCLELFDKDAKSEHIAKQIRDSLDLAPADIEAEWAETRAKTEAGRRRLDDYRNGIHDPGPAGLSTWSAHQELARLGDGPWFEIPADFLARTASDSERILTDLLDLPVRIPGGRVQPGAWSLAGAVDFEQMDRAAVRSAVIDLTNTRTTIDQLDPELRTMVDQLIDPNSMLEQARAIGIAMSGGLRPDEVERVLAPGWSDTATQLTERIRTFQTSIHQLSGIAQDTALTTDVNDLIARANEAAVAGALRRNRALRELHVATLTVLRDQGERPATDVLQTLQWIQQLQAEWAAINQLAGAVPALALPPGFDPRSPDWLQWIESRIASLPDEARAATGAIPRLTLQLVAAGRADANTVVWTLQTAGGAWNTFISQLGVDSATAGRWLAGRTFADAWRASLDEWNRDGDRLLDLQRWCDVAAAVSGLSSMGLDTIAAAILDGAVATDDAAEMFQRGLARTALEERVDHARFDVFDPNTHDRTVEDYARRHGSRRTLMQKRIPAELVAGRPAGQGQRVGVWGQIDRHLAARRRRISIRGLMDEFGQHVTDLTPCFLMSPDSVARFLPPGKVTFDLVVFDEASQIEVPRAVGALGRAKAAVVVGDSKQMPPSRFGGAASDPDDLENGSELEIIDLESLLDECRESNLPTLTLACHYRSRHEALIAFSNQHFYDDRLLTFPNPDGSEQTPIGWRRIDGRFRRRNDQLPEGGPYREDDWPVGTNRLEAEAVVAEIEQRVADWHADPSNRRSEDPGPSIGVVTSNIQQRDLIRDLLAASTDDRVTALLDRDDSSGLLVQNLESVQGDERDVFIMSIGFAPRFSVDDHGVPHRGKLPMNFGPLNKKGGERRLNVAVTRAREEALVFCSFDPEEMDLSASNATGVHLLHAYLSGARTGAGRSPEMVGRIPSEPDRHRREVARTLEAAGLEVSEDVGLSAFRIDVAVRRPGADRWQVAILLDGPRWADQPTAYDRDVLPMSVLRMMGWPQVVRVWLPAWLSLRDEVLSAIDNALDAAEAAARPAPVPPPLPPELRPQPIDPLTVVPTTSEQTATSSLEPAITSAPGTRGPAGAPPEPEPRFGDDAPVFRIPDELTLVDTDPTLLDRIGEPDADEQLRSRIVQTADLIGPVLRDDLCRIVGRRCGLGRVRQSRIDAIAPLIDPSMLSVAGGETVVWPTGAEPTTWHGFRRNDDRSDRNAATTPLIEIANLATAYVTAGVRVERLELVREVGRLLGSSRIGGATRERLNSAVDVAVELGRIVPVDGDSFGPPV
ncbi:MAG: DUF4011 domain-containing protein [Microthrixaceae bacterium]